MKSLYFTRSWMRMFSVIVVTILMVSCNDDSNNKSITGPVEPTPTAIPTPTPTPQVTPTPKITPTATPTPTPEPTRKPLRPSDKPVTYIVAVGNSITYGTGASSSGGYPEILEGLMWEDGYNGETDNEGVPGEKSPETESRFSSALSGNDIVLLMIGTNDAVVPQTCPGGDCETIRHIESMIDEAQSRGVLIAVSTIIPARSNDIYADRNSDIQRLNSEIISLAGRKQAILVDNYSAIVANGGDSLYSDRLHPNDAGYAVIAREWYGAIRRYLND